MEFTQLNELRIPDVSQTTGFILGYALSTKCIPVGRDAIAPDGSDVRVLLALAGGSMAHFELAPGETSIAVAHRTVEEIWFFLAGRGDMWRQQDAVSYTHLTLPTKRIV